MGHAPLRDRATQGSGHMVLCDKVRELFWTVFASERNH